MGKHRHVTVSCTEISDLLPTISDGQLDADQAPDVFAHLAVCSTCQEELALHDLCSLALAGDRLPDKDPAPVVHFHIPRWLSLPLAAAAGLALLVLLRNVTYDAPESKPTLADRSREVEILHVIPAGPDNPRERYLVRIGGPDGETRWVDPSQLDDTVRDLVGHPLFRGPVPVGFQP